MLWGPKYGVSVTDGPNGTMVDISFETGEPVGISHETVNLYAE